MGRPRAFRPMVGDELEARVALSLAAPMPMLHHVSPRDVVPTQHRLFLNGSVKGDYHVLPVASPIAGTLYDLDGEGRVNPLGFVLGRGRVRVNGPTPEGPLGGGQFKLEDWKGVVNLELRQSATPTAIVPLPGRYYFQFKIHGGTDAYKGATGGGWAVLRLEPPTALNGSFSLTFHSTPPPPAKV